MVPVYMDSIRTDGEKRSENETSAKCIDAYVVKCFFLGRHCTLYTKRSPCTSYTFQPPVKPITFWGSYLRLMDWRRGRLPPKMRAGEKGRSMA